MSDLYICDNIFSSGFQDKPGHCRSHILVWRPTAEELIHVLWTHLLKEEENIYEYDGLLNFQYMYFEWAWNVYLGSTESEH